MQDYVTNRINAHLTRRLRQSHERSNKRTFNGLAILQAGTSWAISHNVQNNAQYASVTTCPPDGDRYFSSQLVTWVRMYNPSHPERGHGVSWVRTTANHTPHTSPGRLEAMCRQIDLNLHLGIGRAVENYDEMRKAVRAAAHRPSMLYPARPVDHEWNNGTVESWDNPNLKGLIGKLSSELANAVGQSRPNPFSRGQLVTNQLVNATVRHDHVRVASVEVPHDRTRRFDGRGSLIKQMMHIQDAYGMITLRVRMRTKSTRHGILGDEQFFRASIPLLNPEMVGKNYIWSAARPFLDTMKRVKNAPSLPSGFYPAVLSPEITSTLIHEAASGHNFSGTYLMDNETALMRQRGTILFGCPVDVHIDPTIEGMLGSYNYDIEGVAGRRIQVVRDGKLNEVLLGRRAAAFFGKRPTGSMRFDHFDDSFDDTDLHFDSEREPTIPEERTSNMIATALDPKPLSHLHNRAKAEARRRGLEFYVVLDTPHGAEITTDKGDVTLYNVLGYTVNIDTGTRKPFRGVHARGNSFDITNSIVAMSGDNTEPWHGICGGESGDIPVTEFAPSALSTGISLHQTLGESLFDEDDSRRGSRSRNKRKGGSISKRRVTLL